jgi:hypothetical protein
MMVIFLSVLCLILLIALIFVVFYALRWARIIFVLEDDLEEAIEIHQRTVNVLENILKMQMFFDSPEVKAVVTETLESVKMCQLATQRLIQNFTQRSKQKYIRETEDEAN